MNHHGKPHAALNAWDQRLIDKHLSFYRSLHNGNRTPKTKAQHHFILVCSGYAASGPLRTCSPKTPSNLGFGEPRKSRRISEWQPFS